jgi:hypothetical protein
METRRGRGRFRIFAHPQHEKDRERLRQRAEDFINEIGAANVVSLIEHEPRFGPFSVVVWWLEVSSEGQGLGHSSGLVCYDHVVTLQRVDQQ